MAPNKPQRFLLNGVSELIPVYMLNLFVPGQRQRYSIPGLGECTLLYA